MAGTIMDLSIGYLDFNSNHASVSIFEDGFPLKHKTKQRSYGYNIPVHVDL